MKLDNRIWVGITVIVCAAVLAAGWFIGVSPFLSSASAAADSLSQVQAQNAQTAAENKKLTAAEGESDTLNAQLDSLRKAVPAGVDATGFISEVNSIAASTGVELKAITLSTPVAYASPAAPVTPAASASSGSTASPSASPSASASATPAPAATPTGPVPTTNALISSSNFVVVPVTISIDGTADQTSAFLKGLQYGDRLVLVTGLSRSAQETSGFNLDITGSIYVIKDTAPAAATTGTTSNG